jgi:16S rRNA (guanine1207-N2)-methyltransferase
MGASFVHLLDADLLAVAAARQNLSRLGLPNAMALASDVLQAVEGQTFDQIATNPPFHAGKAVEYLVAQEFIRQSWQVLEPGGQLWLVANRFIRYEQAMEPYFTKVESIAETGKYHLLLGTK